MVDLRPNNRNFGERNGRLAKLTEETIHIAHPHFFWPIALLVDSATAK